MNKIIIFQYICFMKKLLLILLCVPLIFSCGEKNVNDGEKINKLKLRTIDTTFSNGVHYIGGWLNNKMSGFGEVTYPDGGNYIGEFENGMANGNGTAYYSDGSNYVGQFVNNQKQGKGTYSLHMILGGVEHFFYSYKGDFYNNQYNGYGKMTYENGTVEEGLWENGEFMEGK